ncbi:MAG TPA: phosphoenolpyruvate carboxylase, partial [Mycobacterium sp.]
MAEAPDSLEPVGAVQRTRIGREATEPMREDIRLLGAILGDTVREQNGDEVFDLVERARIASFRVRRSEIERAEVAQMFDGIEIDRAIPVIRAFSHFALLANVAEDIHRERRRAIHVKAGEPPQDSTLAATYQKLDSAHLDAATVAESLTGALVSPVITAHPTETRRRTVFDAQHRITQLMRLHAHGHTETDDGRDIDTELRRQVLTLWQTALVRLARLQISDEIAVGLRYYQAAFFDVVPKVNAEVRDALRRRWPDADLLTEPILRPGSWIGGDRDGNHNVTADVVRLATGSAAYTALGRYAAELTALEQELSMSARLVAVTDDLAALAEACDEPARGDEPYRRALRVIHGRLTATAAQILDQQPDNLLDLGLAPYSTPGEMLADLNTIDASLRANGSALLADDRLARLREAVHVFGFHLSGLDMRQNSDVHEEVVAELLAWSGVHPDYCSLSEDERVNILADELSTRRPLVGDREQLSELARKELAIITAAARAVDIYGPPAVPNYIISMCRSVSDLLEAAILLKECGLLDASGSEPYCPVGIVPLFETIDDLRRGGSILEAALDLPVYQSIVRARGDSQEIMLGYS